MVHNLLNVKQKNPISVNKNHKIYCEQQEGTK